jgi:tRNA-Thr(GGU) m(6)t(6)A37 methyltransferase TsaA
MEKSFTLYPVGVIHKEDDVARIEVFPEYEDALCGLSGFSHMDVYFWFHKNDDPEQRKILKVHPRKNPENPLTGVFATHSPVRPNLIGHTTCKILSIHQNWITVEEIDAFDQSPVIDIKGYSPRKPEDVAIPPWLKIT